MTKNVFIPILLCLFAFFKLGAQNFSIGLKAGGQTSDYSDVSDVKMAFLWHAGIFTAYKMPNKLQALAGLEISAQGVDDAENDKYSQRELHLNLPVTLRYPVIKNLFLEAGLQAGYQLSGKLKIKDDEDGDGSYDRLDIYERLHFALVLGTAYQITDHISAGARFNLGLNPVFKVDDDPRSRVIQVFAAYQL